MGVIVCATRGGEGSRAAQLTAIQFARAEDHQLVFLYVVDKHIIGEPDETLKGAVHAEFHWVGQVMLQIACQRAERAGLIAEMAIRDGAVRDEIEKFLREKEATRLLLGAPRHTSPVFGDDAIEQFAQTIEADTGVPVQVVRPEDYAALLEEIRY